MYMMNMTIGEMMFFGGIAGAVFLSLMLILQFATTGKKRRRLIDRINQELE